MNGTDTRTGTGAGYFQFCRGVEDIKRRYRDLAKANHPDLGGDCATMQAINAAYHAALADMDGTESQGTDGKTHTYRYDRQAEQEIIEKIRDLLAALPAGVEVLLIGCWIWISGTRKEDTRTREALKAAGCQWHRVRGLWYWRQAGRRHYGRRSREGLEGLAAKYGYREFSREENAVTV